MPVRACCTAQRTVLGALKAELLLAALEAQLLLADQHTIQVSIHPVAWPDLHAANHNPHLQGGKQAAGRKGGRCVALIAEQLAQLGCNPEAGWLLS